MNKDEIFKEADKIIDMHTSKQLNKPVVSGSLLMRSLQLLEEMIDNHDADAVRMTDVHYTEVKKIIKDIRRSKRLQRPLTFGGLAKYRLAQMLNYRTKACGGILPNHCYKPFFIGLV